MKQFFAFALSIVLLLLCCGCTGEPEPTEPTETVPCTEVPQTQHIHTFGDWVPAETQMQRLCTACGETELRDMTSEEQFYSLLRGHWEPYEVTMLGVTRLVYYLRTGIWHVYADYDGGDSLTYVSSLSERGIDQFTKKLEIHYSHFDAQTGIHHATATSADGHSAQIQLETGHGEPLLYLTPDPETDLFDRVVFSRYEQIAPIVVGTWSGIKDGTINSITFHEDQTFTSNIEPFTSGTWQLCPADSNSGVGGIQLFYQENGRSVFDVATFIPQAPWFPDAEDDQLGFGLSGPRFVPLRKLSPERLQTIIDTQRLPIVGTWDSKSKRSYLKDEITHIWTGHTLTVHEDGTFTLTADIPLSGTWKFTGFSGSGDSMSYNYLFTYPSSGSKNNIVTVSANSTELSFAYNPGTTTTYLYFARYTEEEWDHYLAGPDLLPGNYVSKKIVRSDKSGQNTEEDETGYTLTINEDGTVTGTLHKNVSGIWFYLNKSPNGGHWYVFRMDHTPPEQLSERNNDGTLVFDTKIDGEHVVIYFYPK